jgi:hypothetical protein
LEGLRGERRSNAARAVDGDGRLLVGQATFYGKLQIAPSDVDGTGHGTLLVLVRLAHVEQCVVVETRGDLVRVDLTDLGLRGIQ